MECNLTEMEFKLLILKWELDFERKTALDDTVICNSGSINGFCVNPDYLQKIRGYTIELREK